MGDLQILEELRTKGEVLNYFKQLGKNITEEELTAIKQSYEKAQESSGALTMQQLDDVAGGAEVYFTEEYGEHNEQKGLEHKQLRQNGEPLGIFLSKIISVDYRGVNYAALVLPDGREHLDVHYLNASVDLGNIDSINSSEAYVRPEGRSDAYNIAILAAKSALEDRVVLKDGSVVSIFGTEGDFRSKEEQYIANLKLTETDNEECSSGDESDDGPGCIIM